MKNAIYKIKNDIIKYTLAVQELKIEKINKEHKLIELQNDGIINIYDWLINNNITYKFIISFNFNCVEISEKSNKIRLYLKDKKIVFDIYLYNEFSGGTLTAHYLKKQMMEYLNLLI